MIGNLEVKNITLDSELYSAKGKKKIKAADLIEEISIKIRRQPVVCESHNTLIAYELRNRTGLPIENCLNLMIQYLQR